MLKIPAPVTATVACLTIAATLTACGAEKDPKAEAAARKSAATEAVPHFDPPVRFSAGGRPLLVPEHDSGPDEPENVVLSGAAAYFQTGEGLHASDVRTGAITWTARPRTSGNVRGAGTPPLPATLGGRRVVVGAFEVTVVGQGTTADQEVIEVLAADPATGRIVLDDVIAVPPAFMDNGAKVYTGARVIGADDKAIVIHSGSMGLGATLVVDPATHRLRWFEEDMEPVMYSNGQIIADTISSVRGLLGVKYYKLRSIDAATRAVRWSTAELWRSRVSPAGPGLVALSSSIGNDDGGLFDVSTGKRSATWPAGSEEAEYECVHDDRSVTVCFTDEEVYAFDAATAKPLWALPKDGRIAPKVTAAWHGAVYGTTDNGPVVIDARTGQDREAAPGVAPLTVGPYGGLTDGDGELTFNAAVG